MPEIEQVLGLEGGGEALYTMVGEFQHVPCGSHASVTVLCVDGLA